MCYCSPQGLSGRGRLSPKQCCCERFLFYTKRVIVLTVGRRLSNIWHGSLSVRAVVLWSGYTYSASFSVFSVILKENSDLTGKKCWKGKIKINKSMNVWRIFGFVRIVMWFKWVIVEYLQYKPLYLYSSGIRYCVFNVPSSSVSLHWL